jgi:D-glycero-D-manno-heptose 1,7-bisphosphate phosphatase
MTKTKVVFLDRDGTLNEDRGYVDHIQDWQFTDRAVEAVRMLRDAGFAVALVSNQSGIARGLFTVADVDELHAQVRELLVRGGADLDAVAYCPHGPDEGCGCRKPRPGLAREVERQLGRPSDHAASWTVGDKPSDLGFGVALGTRTALLRSRYWSNGELEPPPDILADCLYEAARFLLDGVA